MDQSAAGEAEEDAPPSAAMKAVAEIRANIARRAEEQELVRSERMPNATPEMLRAKRRADAHATKAAAGTVSDALSETPGMASYLRRSRAIAAKRAAERVDDPGSHAPVARGDLWAKHRAPEADVGGWKSVGSRVVEPTSPRVVDGAKSLEKAHAADEAFDFWEIRREVQARLHAEGHDYWVYDENGNGFLD